MPDRRRQGKRGILSAGSVGRTPGGFGLLASLDVSTTLNHPAIITATTDDATIGTRRYRARRGVSTRLMYTSADSNGNATLADEFGNEVMDTW